MVWPPPAENLMTVGLEVGPGQGGSWAVPAEAAGDVSTSARSAQARDMTAPSTRTLLNTVTVLRNMALPLHPVYRLGPTHPAHLKFAHTESVVHCPRRGRPRPRGQIPCTGAGLVGSMFAGWPSCPKLLSPQAYRIPFDV